MGDVSTLVGPAVALISAVGGFMVAFVTLRTETRRHDANQAREMAKLRAEFGESMSAELAVRRLLMRTSFKRRTFEAIKFHVGGYDDDELRRLLLRAGAVRFHDDKETWGLIERNEQELDNEDFTKKM